MTITESAAPPVAGREISALPPGPAPLTSSADPSKPRSRRARRIGWALAALVVVGGVGLGSSWLRAQPSRRSGLVDDLPRQLVSRTDLSTVLTAAGRVESSSKTTISCELERLEIQTGGHSISSNGSATILEIIPEGTQVEKGDILCRLDSSDYEELVRQQQIKTEQSRAAWQQAKLNFEVAGLAVEEYRDGLYKQTVQSMEGQIALAESDLERSVERLRWTEKMLDKKYAPASQRSAAERNLAQAKLDLMTSRFDLLNFREYGSPKTLKELSSEVEKRRAEELANNRRVVRLEERLAHYRKMVDFCTIRAPHDGFVIYANDPYRRNAVALDAGVQVRQRQELFYLPDLHKIEVITYLHESVARRVIEGLPARAKIEGLPGRTLGGRVVSIGPLPVESPSWTIDENVKYFVAVVKLDAVPDGILPGMTAEVEIDVDRGLDVLAVSPQAVAVEQGHDVCYVAGADGLERRQVTLGRSSRDLLEVTGGLKEGESVVMNPAKVESLESLVTPVAEPAASEVANDPGPASGAGYSPTVE